MTGGSMSDILDEMIENYRGEDGKLTCSDAFKVASKLKISTAEVGQKANDLEVFISACDLGQFGKQPLGVFKTDVFEDLEAVMDEQKKVFCKDARVLAQKSNLKSVRTAIIEGGLDVKYCELGCFAEKQGTKLYIKTKTWMENQYGDLLFGKGKTEILEAIDRFGSIAKAAEHLNMSYKKAWSHIQVLQKNLDDVLVETQKGAGEQGGTVLTAQAYVYMDRYKQLQSEIEAFANERFNALFLEERKRRKRQKKGKE
jgi:molybdate transport repressor ModE-like protein